MADDRQATYEEVIAAAMNVENFDDLLEACKNCNISMKLFLGLTVTAKHYALEIVNNLFEHAKKTQQEDPEMAFLVQLRDMYDELIAASDGRLFWAEYEDATRFDIYKIAALPLIISPAGLEMYREFRRVHNEPGGVMRPYDGLLTGCLCWLTTDAPASTIKPARRSH